MQWNDLIGARLGQYEIIEELGRGASARVYKAYQESMQRYVAVKVLGNDAEDRAGFVRRFEREAEVVAQLNHPNIVAVYDSGEADGLVYLVMQCVNGGTFRQRMGQAVGVDIACSAAFQVARALQHAHSRGVIHRDVKPSNMLIDSDDNNRILLTDFGIAKLQGMRGLTKSGTTIGTAEYMSPEQAEGRDVDGRADVYSLGCVLYEALAGRAPFVGSTPVSVLYQQVHARADYIRALNPLVPRELARVLDMALAKHPEDRFDSAETFAQALQPFTIGYDRGTQSGFARRGPQSAHLPGAAGTAPPLVSGFAAASVGPLPSVPAAHPAYPGYPQAPLHGLGSEGLDALFPDDPEARLAARRTAPPPAAFDRPSAPGAGTAGYADDPTTLPSRRAASTTGPRPTIPLKALNSQPLGTDAPSGGMPAAAEAAANAATLPGAGVEDLPTIELPPLAPAMAPVAPRQRNAAAAGRHLAPPVVPPRRPARFDAPRRARRTRALPARANRAWMRAVVILAAIAALGIVWVGARAAASLSAHQPPRVANRPTAVSTALPTVAPTAAPTQAATPAATATPSPQQIADAQAAAAFRAITVFTGQDGGCASTTTAFTTTQAISVNLCVAQSARSGVVSVQLRQGGAVLTTLTQGYSVLPGYWYAYTTHPRPAGNYDMLVTYNNGTAADITFTVN